MTPALRTDSSTSTLPVATPAMARARSVASTGGASLQCAETGMATGRAASAVGRGGGTPCFRRIVGAKGAPIANHVDECAQPVDESAVCRLGPPILLAAHDAGRPEVGELLRPEFLQRGQRGGPLPGVKARVWPAKPPFGLRAHPHVNESLGASSLCRRSQARVRKEVVSVLALASLTPCPSAGPTVCVGVQQLGAR